MLKSLNEIFKKFKIITQLKTELFTVTIHKGLNKVSSASTVMSGKFELASGKSQGNVREFCFVQSV